MRFNELNNCQHTLHLVKTMNVMAEYYDFLKDVDVFDLDNLTINKYGGYNTDNLVRIGELPNIYLLRKISNYECNFLYAQLYKVTIL